MPSEILIGASCAVAAWLMTALVRHDALARGLVDLPSERSLHTIPTPRGVGIAIAASTLLGFAWGVALGLIDDRLGLAIGGGVLVAFVGWWDDRAPIQPRYRLLLQAMAGVWALWCLDGYPVLHLGSKAVEIGLAGAVLGLLGIVWAANLFNFMDGIDGLAGMEAISVGCGGAMLLWKWGIGDGPLAPMVVAASSFGFLLWNWSPAKVFMGDAGSGFLGFVFAVVAVWSGNRGGPPVILWAVLGMVFVFDATVTLLRRAAQGESLTEPHLRHAYQRLVQAGWSHRSVCRAALALNLILLGLALLLPPLVALAAAILAAGCAYLLVERLQPMWG